VACGDTVSVETWCQADPSCTRTELEVLACCGVTLATVQSRVPAGSLTPTSIVVTGTLLGCAGDQVVVGSSITGQSPPAPIEPLTGGFRVTLPIPSTTAPSVKCHDRIQVSAWCAQDLSCIDTRDMELDCPGCFRAQVSATPAAACAGPPPRRDVTFNATVHVPVVPVGQTWQFCWVYDDPQFPLVSNQGPIHPIMNTTGNPNTAFPLPAETYAYLPGTYSPYLLLVPPPYECDPDRVPLSVSVQCPPTCPIGAITATVDPACSNGKHRVTVRATVTASAAGASGGWRVAYPPGGVTYGKPFTVPGGQTQDHTSNPDLEEDFDLPPGTHTVSLNWTAPTGCPPVTATITVPSCPFHCGVTLDFSPKPLPCLPLNGSVQVTVTAALVPPNPGYTGPYDWTVTPPQGQPVSFTQTSQTHPNPERLVVNATTSGTYTVEVAVDTDPTQCKDANNNPKYNASASLSIPVASCCPMGTLEANEVSACQWFFKANVSNPNNLALTYSWAFHDGAQKQTTTATTTHTFAPGSPTTGNATVTVTAPGCAPLTLTATVTHRCMSCPPGQELDPQGNCVPSPCPPGQERDPQGNCVPIPCPPGQHRNPQGNCVPDEDGCLKIICPILLALALLLLLLASVAVIALLCLRPPDPGTITALIVFAVIAAVVGLALLALWVWVCSRLGCGLVKTIFRVLSGIAALCVLLAGLFALIQDWPCVGAWLIDAGLWSLAATIVANVANAVGCNVWTDD
jgi:hypothetical protein